MSLAHAQDPDGGASVMAISPLCLLRDQTPAIFDGQNSRDYVYVSDVAYAFHIAADNVCGSERFNFEAAARGLQSLITSAVGTDGFPKHVPVRVSDVAHSAQSHAKPTEFLGWSLINKTSIG